MLTWFRHIQRAVLYDGSPFVPDVQTFIKLIGEQKYVKDFRSVF